MDGVSKARNTIAPTTTTPHDTWISGSQPVDATSNKPQLQGKWKDGTKDDFRQQFKALPARQFKAPTTLVLESDKHIDDLLASLQPSRGEQLLEDLLASLQTTTPDQKNTS